MRSSLLLLILSMNLWAKVPLLAVGDLTPRGVSGSDAAIISDRLRNTMLQTGQVRVLERQEMDKILREQAFQKSGACDQSECAVEIGRLLAVDRMVVGTVGKLGDIYTISARILDVGSGEIVFSASEDEPGSLETLLTRTVPAIGNRLADGADRAIARDLSTDGFADMEVHVDDTSASLRIDGRPIAGRSPFLVEHIAAGFHRLEAKTRSRRGALEVELAPDDLRKVLIELDSGSTSAKFFSTPTGAEVFIDGPNGTPVGATPLKLDQLLIGPHRVTFRKDGYLDTTISVTATMDAPLTLRCGMTAGGTVSVDPVPDVPFLLIRDKDTLPVLGRGRIQLPSGIWRFVLQHKAWEPASDTFEVRKGETVSVHPIRHFARLHVLCDTSAQIWIDRVPRGQAPAILDSIEPGAHIVTLRTSGRKDWTQEIHVRPGQDVSLRARLESRYAWLQIRTATPARVELDSVGVGSTHMLPSPLCPGCDPESVRLPQFHEWNSDTLQPRRHHLKVFADRRIPWETDLELAPGATVAFDADLPWSAEEIARQRARTRLGWRIATGIGSALTATAATYFALQWKDAADRSDKIQSQYDAASTGFPEHRSSYSQARTEANSALTRSLASGTIAVLAATGFALTWVF